MSTKNYAYLFEFPGLQNGREVRRSIFFEQTLKNPNAFIRECRSMGIDTGVLKIALREYLELAEKHTIVRFIHHDTSNWIKLVAGAFKRAQTNSVIPCQSGLDCKSIDCDFYHPPPVYCPPASISEKYSMFYLKKIYFHF